jgi:Alkylmercury lyase
MARFVGKAEHMTGNLALVRGGEQAYLSCAADILLTGLYKDLKGEAVCPVCGAKISIDVEGRKVGSLSPPGAVLHYVRFNTNNPRMFGVVCEDTFAFDTVECLHEWEGKYAGPAGSTATPDEFLRKVAEVKGLPRE